MPTARLSLPVDAILPELLQKLEKSNSAVLQASPGSGKTTRVPPALLSAAFRLDKEVLVLEPRRLAAKWAARRVAEELGEEIGETIGYQFRFENVGSPATRVRFLTEGMLMRKLLSDPQLQNVACVILDEFHERHLHGDIALAYLRSLQLEKRPDLKIIVMSATLEAETLSQFLGNAPILEVKAQLHPVAIEYLPSAPSKPLEQLVRDAVSSAVAESGDVLVFLPGMSEIRRAADAIASISARHGLLVLPLHGELSREEQDLAMQRSRQKKVILATNVAETSLTIEGVTVVIDSGLHRQASYSWWSGVPALKTRPISRASAIQRAGRAGRTAPGRCLRLYSKHDFEGRAPFDTPEIRRADLCQTYLELKSLGIASPESFSWFEAPAAASLDSARGLLYKLGAFDGSSLSSIGKRMVRLPAHPRIGRLLIEADKKNVLDLTGSLCALLNEGRLDQLDALEQLERPLPDESVRRTKKLLLQNFKDQLNPSHDHALIAQCVLRGFPDRVAKKRAAATGAETDLVFSSGGSASVENSGLIASGDTFVTLDIQEQQHLGQTRSKLRVRSVCKIEPEWLFDLEPSLIEEKEELIWDPQKEAIFEVSKMTYDQLTLMETRGEPKSPERLHEASELLLKTVFGIEPVQVATLAPSQWIQAFSRYADAEIVESFFARLDLIKRYFPELEGTAPKPLSLLEGKLKASEIRAIDWSNELLAIVDPAIAPKLDQLTPTHITLPNGRKPLIHYKLGQMPWVESRLQDFFGVRQPLNILQGRCPLTLHLLAPNMRAVQITTDLMGFWDRAYAEVRRELSRRYPRHVWPENPREAEPVLRKPPRR